MSSLSKVYDPVGVEHRWYAFWEDQGYFAPHGNSSRTPYCIMIPPPNVTGSLHMGHAFQDTLMDALVRYHRMKGCETLWQTGTDHAGIATQMVVERQLEGEGKTRHDLGREPFVDRIWKWREQSGGAIVRQLRRMGTSCDWNRERFTMDEGLSSAVREVFVRLYEEGLIYRGKRLVNWDPALHTALSDLEVVSEEEEGHLWYMRYPLVGGDDGAALVVATTRPETMLGDVAVAVHPEDERYRSWIGKEVELPLTERRLPVVADDSVDPLFGTGCVKITPAHDFNDYEIGKRHGLPMINIFTVDAALNDHEAVPEVFRCLDRYEARRRIVKALESQNLLEKIEPHRMMIPRGDRSKAVLEPYLTDQWFVKTGPLAREAVRCVEEGRIRFVPESWSKTYFEWMRNIEDWCISRQIWWGHRIPVWYGPDDHCFVARTEEEAQQQAVRYYRERDGTSQGGVVTLRQDTDVLDTWFSSALWPFSTLGWPERTPEFQRFYPTSVLVTGFDIIFFWVARMIMMGLKFTKEIPFRTVYIHGLVRDGDGVKMSKSKGNILDPLDLIDGVDLKTLITKRTRDLMQPEMAARISKETAREFPKGIAAHGTDALRFTFASLATLGRDIKFDMGRMEGYRNFCNKLWNASRFVLMYAKVEERAVDRTFSMPDRWILSRLEDLKLTVETSITAYRFDEAAHALYHFLWGSYCDWYLEMVKPVLYGTENPESRRAGARHTMSKVLETALRLLHPFMPFITEELWQKIAPLTETGKKGKSIMTAPWPDADPMAVDPEVDAELTWVMAFVTAVRTIRGEMHIAPGKRLNVVLEAPREKQILMQRHEEILSSLASLEKCVSLDEGDEPPSESATAILDGARLFVPIQGVVNLAEEAERLKKSLEKLKSDLSRVERKLSNPQFIQKAKPHVVDGERLKKQKFLEKQEGMMASLKRIQAIQRQNKPEKPMKS